MEKLAAEGFRTGTAWPASGVRRCGSARWYTRVASPTRATDRSFPVIDQDRETFARLMAALAETLEKDLAPQRLEIYFRALATWPIESVAAAADAAIRTLKFFLSPWS
jgi:hypothetical protein